jgi:hypothetical protein
MGFASTMLFACVAVDDRESAETEEVSTPPASCTMSGGATCWVTSYDARRNIARVAGSGVRREAAPWTTTIAPPPGTGRAPWTFVIPTGTANGCSGDQTCGDGGKMSCSVQQPAGGSTSCGSQGGTMWCFAFKADGTIDESSSSGHCAE